MGKKGKTTSSKTKVSNIKKVSKPSDEAANNEATCKDNDDGDSEVWDVLRIVSDQDAACICRVDGCREKAIVVWSTTVNKSDEWPVCESCQEKEFGGWPEGFPETLTKEPDQTSLPHECDSRDIKQESSEDHCNQDEEKIVLDRSQHADEMVAKADVQSSSPEPSKDSGDQAADDEVWEVIKIMTRKDLEEAPIKCSSEPCSLAAACVYVSNLAPKTRWYSCLDCQQNDFGGWPDVSELPIQFMSEEHKQAMVSKCSARKDAEMPDFRESLLSPTKKPNVSSHIPQHNGSQTDDKNSVVTPSPHTKTAPSKQALAMHKKWQEAAEALGGPEARIVVSKPAAKKLIFDLLYEAFAPMNITQIHKVSVNLVTAKLLTFLSQCGLQQELRAIVPSPVLKSCLDDMALDTQSAAFIQSDDDDDHGTKERSKAVLKSDEYPGSLAFKAGRSPNNTLYYVDHAKLLNNGNGLPAIERNELASKVAAAQAEKGHLETTLQNVRLQTTKLQAEPTNDVATARLESEERELAQLQDQVESARKLKVNEKYKRQLERRTEYMVAQWRQRRRICMEFLISLEENTEGSVSLKKCLAGDGPVDIDSDEAVVKATIASRKTKLFKSFKRPLNKKIKLDNEPAIAPTHSFVGVKLTAKGTVERIHWNAEES